MWGAALLVPVYSIDGDLWSLQSILADGSKKFLPGARVAGGYHPIGYYLGHEPKLYVAEGWATSAAIAQVR